MSGISTTFDGFQKRSGLIVPFSWQKIELAINRSVDEVSRKHSIQKNEGISSKVAGQVLQQLSNPQSEFFVHPDETGKRIPRIEDVQDLVEILLAENGETLTVAAYKRYRKQREMARRNIRVRGAESLREINASDDSLLLVESSTQNINLPWDRKRIVKQILDKTDLSVELAINVAKSVENRIIASNITIINTTLIRELVNNELMERGLSHQLRDLSLYRVSKDFLETLMRTDSNLVNNPDAVNQGIAKLVLKQWALDTLFSPEVKRAHDTGVFHLHNLGQPPRFCGLQTVTINIPQTAYRAARTGGDILKNFFAELDHTMELASDALLQKRVKTEEMTQDSKQLDTTSGEETACVDLDSCSYILGLIGLNDAVNFLIGQELHESKEAQKFGLNIVEHMHAKAKKLTKKNALKFTLEESSAEITAGRLAKSDLIYFAEEAKGTVKGTKGAEYYTLAKQACVSPENNISKLIQHAVTA